MPASRHNRPGSRSIDFLTPTRIYCHYHPLCRPMIKSKVAFLSAGIVLVVWEPGCASRTKFPSAEQAGMTISQPAKALEYRVSPGDTLKVTVLRRSDLQPVVTLDAVRVDANGKISLPLVGGVNLKGMDLDGARSSIETAYSEQLIFPVVYVEVKESRGSQIFVLGEVRTPGIYRAAANMTALEAVMQAGGLTSEAEKGGIVLLRRGAAGPSASGNAAKLDFKKLVEQAEFKQDVALLPGDILYVPPDYIARSDRLFTHISKMLAPITNTSAAVGTVYLISQGGGLR